MSTQSFERKILNDDRNQQKTLEIGISGEQVHVPVKKKKVLDFENAYLRAIPRAKQYEKSFMHRDVITHILATKTDFIITASQDGHVKFWKKIHAQGIEFVKHFRAHLGSITKMCVNYNGSLMATVCAKDSSIKVFDVPNFDMINMIKFNFSPLTAVWTHRGSDIIQSLAVSEQNEGTIHIFDGKGTNEEVKVIEKLHSHPVHIMEYNCSADTIISIDRSGMIEYWAGSCGDFKFPDSVEWTFKTDTDLYEFVKLKTMPTCLAVCPNGRFFATLSMDRRVRIFRFVTGKLVKIIDETLKTVIADGKEKKNHGIPSMDWHRRVATEKELDRSVDCSSLMSVIFDDSGHFLLYGSPLGVKVTNLTTNVVVREIGKSENIRFLGVALCRAVPGLRDHLQGAASSIETEASENPALKPAEPDPMLVCTAFKKNRFYLFTNQEPFRDDDNAEQDGLSERDVFNEKPLKEDAITAVDEEPPESRSTDSCILHTTMGDIHPWLNGKHTVFGHAVNGMDVVQNISKVQTNMKTGRPYEEISVISITLK